MPSHTKAERAKLRKRLVDFFNFQPIKQRPAASGNVNQNKQLRALEIQSTKKPKSKN